jgi:hypothetical protein
MGIIANTLDLFGGFQNSSKDNSKFEQNDKISVFTKKRSSTNFSEYVRMSDSENWDFEKKMMYISQKIEAVDEKYPFGNIPFEQIYEDPIYNLSFEDEEEKELFDEKFAFVKYVFPKHRSHFEFTNEDEF